MKIEKLEIKGFGKLQNVTLLFSKGFNIVFGNNEAGKSTIQWFIKAMFFGLKGGKAAKDGTPPPLKRYKPWNENDYTGFMEYRLDDNRLYRVGRNFGTNSVRVFDNLFNDITNTFDVSKEKGVHFAEKHMGVNEVCFEKTAFVKQMETRIGEEGSKELYNRMINISQTGFEDVSFRKAQEALREALRNYVGTEKTSTRPLDKVVERLSELKAKREEYISKHDSLFNIENELNNAGTVRNNLEKRKLFLERLKRIVEIKDNVKKEKKIKDNTEDILKNIFTDEEELKVIHEREEDFIRTKEEYSRFEIYDNDDIDALDALFQRYLSLLDSNRKLREDLHNKETELGENKRALEPILAFSELGEGIESYVIEINKDLEFLKKDYERNNLEVLNEKIKNAQGRVKNYKRMSIVSAIMFLILFGLSFTDIHLYLIISFAALIFTAVAFMLKGKVAKELSGYLDEKKISFISISSVIEEINKKQNVLVSIYEKVGAGSIEEFLRLKVEYDTKSKKVAALNSDICRLENDYAINEGEILRLKNKILSKLAESGVIDNMASEFEEEHIKSFKNGVRRYKGLEPSINYTVQRIEDLNLSLKRHFKNAEAICDGKYENKECLKKKVGMAETKLRELEERLKTEVSEINRYSYEGFFAKIFPDMEWDYENSDIFLFNADLSGEYSLIEGEYGKTCEEFNSIQLNIREYETLLKSFSGDDSELQGIEAEIEELENKKSRLEDTYISLKTAHDILTEASEEVQKDFVPVLNYKMADAVKRITGGKYHDLRADSSLALKAIAPETGDVTPVSALSGGTIDQMYLALRIAMADMLVQSGEKLPLIMDEIFSQYDDIRTMETFKFLKELGEQRQIILFTCKSREVELARQVFSDNLNVIELK